MRQRTIWRQKPNQHENHRHKERNDDDENFALLLVFERQVHLRHIGIALFRIGVGTFLCHAPQHRVVAANGIKSPCKDLAIVVNVFRPLSRTKRWFLLETHVDELEIAYILRENNI